MPLKVSAIARKLVLRVEGDGGKEIRGIAPLESAGEDELSFLSNPRYREEATRSRAGAIIVKSGESLPGKTLLYADDPYVAFAEALRLFHPARSFAAGIHSTAVVERNCEIAPDCHVGPFVVIGEGSRLMEGTVVEAGSVVGRNCLIGEGCHLYPRVVLYDNSELGQGVVLHSGVVVGSDGFGYAWRDGRGVKVPQVGRAVIEENVEIGANSTIDRGTLTETKIGAGTKVDNLVQVAHNVRTGKSCVLVAQSGISGSTELGDGVVIAGQSGLVGHIRIGSGCKIGAKSAVTKSLPENSFVTGHPAQPHRRWLKERAMAGRLEEMLHRIEGLEKALSTIPRSKWPKDAKSL